MRTEKHISVRRGLPFRPVRILIYLSFYLCNILLYRFLYSYLYLVLWVMMTVWPIVSAVLLYLLARDLEVLAGAGVTVSAGEKIDAVVQIGNPSFGMTLRAKIHLAAGNTFYGEQGEFMLSTAIPAKQKKNIDLPLCPDLCGEVVLEVKSIEIWDLLGLVCWNKKTDVQTSFLVLPKRLGSEDADQIYPQISDGFSENESGSKRGQDYSEVSGVREYAQGDRVKDIHWKLSAKRDVLLVKERVSMSQEQLVIVPELSGGIQETEQVLAALYEILHTLADTVEARVYWPDPAGEDFLVRRVTEKSDIREVFAGIYQSKKYSGEPVKTAFGRIQREVRRYLYLVCGADGAVVEILENEY